jgi:hypothetical protein
MGRDLAPTGLPESYRTWVAVTGQAVLSIGYGLIVALLANRWHGIPGIVAGGLTGLALYALNFAVFYLMQAVEWPRTEVPTIVTHFVFGMIAAGAYKGLAARRRAET